MNTKIICNNCNEKINKDDAFIDPDNDNLCENCYIEICFLCDKCNVTGWKDDSRDFANNLYCENCIWDLAYECENCDELSSRDDSYYCEDCGSNLCPSCYDEDSCRDDEGVSQDQQLEFQEGRKSKLITVDRFVGAELEAENGNRSELNLPYTFGIKDDGSLDDSGVEIVTPPSKDGALITNIKLACKQLNQAGFEATSSCGLHIHIDLRDIKDNFIKLSRILRTFYAIEDVMFSTQPESRLNSKYCQRRLASYAVTGFPKIPQAKQELVNTMGRSDRYYALNFKALRDHGTIECRLHAGTLNAEKIINWIKLIRSFYEYALNSYNSKKVNELFLTPISEKKIQSTWELLKLDPSLQTYFNKRIEKFTLARLALQHDKAQQLLQYRLKTAKEMSDINKMINKAYKMQDKIREKTKKLIKEVDIKSNNMLQEASAQRSTIYSIKKQLLRELLGIHFKGDIDQIINSWNNESLIDLSNSLYTSQPSRTSAATTPTPVANTAIEPMPYSNISNSVFAEINSSLPAFETSTTTATELQIQRESAERNQ